MRPRKKRKVQSKNYHDPRDLSRKQIELKSHFGDKAEAHAWSLAQNWEDLKEEFFLMKDAAGEYIYRTIRSFAREKYPGVKNRRNYQRLWLEWSISPQIYKVVPHQGDWETERLLGTKKYTAQVTTLQEKVDDELDLLQSGRLLAESYSPYQDRVFRLFKELEQHTGQNILLDVSNAKDEKERRKLEAQNFHRLNNYITTLGKIVGLKTQVDNQFLRCLGWDRPQFIAYFENLRNQEKKNDTVKIADSAISQMLTELAKNQIEKASMYELDLPDDIQDVADRMKVNTTQGGDDDD